jgi:long-chain acyl-CoA synthetase
MNWTNVSDPVFHHAESRPRSPAVIDGGTTLGYGDLADLVGKAAAHLHAAGIVPGERIGVAMATSTDHLILSLGLMRIGAMTLELPPEHPPQDLAAVVRAFSLTRVFVGPGGAQIPDANMILIDHGWRRQIARENGDYRYSGSADDPCTLAMTSGSTGQRRGVVISHADRLDEFSGLAVALADGKAFSSEQPSHFLQTYEMYTYVFYQFLLHQLFIGGPVVMLPRFSKPADLINAIASWDESICMMMPGTCRVLMAAAPERGLLFPQMRAAVCGGAPLFADEKQVMLARVTPNFYEVYGGTPFGPISILRPAEMARKGDTVGQPLPGLTVEIADRNGRPVPSGQIGHLRCRRPIMTRHFLAEAAGRPDLPEGYRDGWYYPGDVGFLDVDGYIHLKARVSDVIVRGGIELFPTEIEAALLAHPSVAEAVVVGRPAGGDQQVVAYVVPRGAAQHAELATHCRSALPPEKQPNVIYYAESLPQAGGGKPDRFKIRQLAIQAAQPTA